MVHLKSLTSASLLAVATMMGTARADDAPLVHSPTSQPATGTKRPTTQLSLSFKDVPLDTVLDYLSEAAGFVIVKDTPVEGRVTLVSRQPVTADEAVMLLNTVLKSNGYTALQQGRVVKVIARDKAKKLGIPVHFGSDPAMVEATDELITQVIPVTNFDAVRLKTDLAPMIGTDADVTANGASNAIVVTDTSSNIKRIMEMISALDRHESANFELRHYLLKNANAVNATKLITAIFRPDDAKILGPKQAAEKAGLDQALHGKLNAVADERTNTIYVTAPPETLKVVEETLKELDANPASAAAIRIFPLKYADATAAVKMLTAIFKPDAATPRNPEAPPRPAADAGLNAHVNAAADERTNSVIVAAPTETLATIEDIFKRLDSDPTSISEMKIVPLLNADSTATAKLIMSLFKPEDTKPINPYQQQRQLPAETGPKINAVADERTNSVLINAPTEALKAILEIVKVLDANPAATSNIKAIQLKNADASATVKLLSTIFKTDEPTAPQQTANPFVIRVQGVTEQASKIKITTAADERTNTLVISAPNETMAVIEGIIEKLDSNPAADAAIFIYRLKNGQAAELEPVLNAVFGNSSGGGNQRSNRNQSNGGIRNPLPTQSAFSSAAGSRGGRGLSQNNSFNSNGNAPAGNQNGYSSQGNQNIPNLPPATAKTATELTGQVLIVAEPNTNSLLVTTAAKYRDKVMQVIEELDRPVPQVLIKVLIAEVTHDNSEDLGVDFSILNQRANGRGERGTSNFGTAAAAAAVNGGLVVNFVESNVNVTLRALATAGKLDVLSRPYILASDNQLASITVGQEVPFITDTRTTDLGQTINTIQYQDIGIILNVTPHINTDGLVILDVAPEISQLTGTTVPISGQVSAPVFAKRSAQSRVGIRDGQTIVIGGLMEDRKTSTVRKIPILGDIPLIGPLFQRIEVTKAKTELLIFLTPHVAQQPEALKPMSQDEIKGTQLTPGAVGPGVFDEHIRGMQRGGNVKPSTQPTTAPLQNPMTPPS